MTQATHYEPTVRETPSGWLAVAPEDGPQIAVTASTEAAARAAFDTEITDWLALRELAAATPMTNA